jgi:hypothetical protein
MHIKYLLSPSRLRLDDYKVEKSISICYQYVDCIHVGFSTKK